MKRIHLSLNKTTYKSQFEFTTIQLSLNTCFSFNKMILNKLSLFKLVSLKIYRYQKSVFLKISMTHCDLILIFHILKIFLCCSYLRNKTTLNRLLRILSKFNIFERV